MAVSLSAMEMQIVETGTGQTLSEEELIQKLGNYQYILMGEEHDNLAHHEIRGKLIQALAYAHPVIVSEHLESSHQVVWGDGELIDQLRSGGFEPKRWDWPVHEKLYQAIRQENLLLVGGNLSRVQLKNNDLSLEKFRSILNRVSYMEQAVRTLEEDIDEGHCRMLTPAQISSMRLSQNLRDASMASEMVQHPGMKILVAGNAHVRYDYGVGKILRSWNLGENAVSVAFIGDGATPQRDDLRDVYDIVVMTDPVTDMKDHCEGIQSHLQRSAKQ